MEEKEELLAREEIAAEVWGDAPTSRPQEGLASESDQEVVQQADEGGEWAGVSPVLRKTIEDINTRLGALDTIDRRLSSAEGRIGSVQQAVFEQRQAAEEAARRVKDAPTKEQIAQAAKSERAWEDLKDEFPEFSEALHDEITSMRQAAEELKQDLEALRAMQAGGGQQQNMAQLQREIDVKLVSVKHPGWQKTVQSEEFGQWLQGQDQAVQQTFLHATDPVECIAVLDAFAGSSAEGNAQNIAASRQRRLEAATTVNKGRSTQTKNPANMTDDEYRAYVAKEIWSD